MGGVLSFLFFVLCSFTEPTAYNSARKLANKVQSTKNEAHFFRDTIARAFWRSAVR